jgi:nucleoside-diphosphate-sugar epimerase
VILYNGATGGLGRYLAGPLNRSGQRSHILGARLEDQVALQRELERLDPSNSVTFIHMAARVSVPACEADPTAAHEINVSLARSTVTAVLDWASRRGASVRVIYVSTGHVYAAPVPGSRLSEADATLPRSVYARTKLEAEQELASLCSTRTIPFLIARVFGLLAPRQAPNYVLPGLIKRARSGDLNGIPGLDFSRDYLDARDVCEDLLLLASVAWPWAPTVTNVCSGFPVTVRDLLRAVSAALHPDAADEMAREARPAPGREDDVAWLVGDPSRFVRLTAATPQRIPLATSVADAVALTDSSVTVE